MKAMNPEAIIQRDAQQIEYLKSVLKVASYFLTTFLVPILLWFAHSTLHAVEELQTNTRSLSEEVHLFRQEYKLKSEYMIADTDALKAQVRTLTAVTEKLAQLTVANTDLLRKRSDIPPSRKRSKRRRA